MLDSRIIDLHFNKVFVKLVLGEEVPPTIASLRVRIHPLCSSSYRPNCLQLVDVDLANSLAKIQGIIATQSNPPTDKVRVLDDADKTP